MCLKSLFRSKRPDIEDSGFVFHRSRVSWKHRSISQKMNTTQYDIVSKAQWETQFKKETPSDGSGTHVNLDGKQNLKSNT